MSAFIESEADEAWELANRVAGRGEGWSMDALTIKRRELEELVVTVREALPGWYRPAWEGVATAEDEELVEMAVSGLAALWEALAAGPVRVVTWHDIPLPRWVRVGRAAVCVLVGALAAWVFPAALEQAEDGLTLLASLAAGGLLWWHWGRTSDRVRSEERIVVRRPEDEA